MSARTSLGILTTTALLTVAAPAAHADSERVVRLAHGPITATLIDAGTPGNSAGDLRTYYVGLTRPGQSKRIGHMTGSLLTTASDEPRPGWDRRTASLVFTVHGAANQIVLGGVATYRQQAPTLTRRESVNRPVIGGSGRFAGASGWCESIHRADNTWRHVFHIAID